MGGILKNPLPADQSAPENEESISEFRKQVLMNTQLNAKLTSKKKKEDAAGASHKHGLPKDTLSLKHEQEAEERLQWNQRNLAANEIAKQQYQDIHIDEPKTPYQGAIDPNGEYYKDDDENEAELENFSLDGEGQSEPAPAQSDEHSRFEEMRKKHYSREGAVPQRRSPTDDDDDDDDDE